MRKYKYSICAKRFIPLIISYLNAPRFSPVWSIYVIVIYTFYNIKGHTKNTDDNLGNAEVLCVCTCVFFIHFCGNIFLLMNVKLRSAFTNKLLEAVDSTA